MATTPLLDKVLERAAAKGIGRDQALNDIASITDQKGPVCSCKTLGRSGGRIGSRFCL